MTPQMKFEIPVLGAPSYDSPLGLSELPNDGIADYTPDSARLPLDPSRSDPGVAFELAGPRSRVYFRGEQVVAGIITCGGLCPGMNHVIRALVLRLWHSYGVRRIKGFRYGYGGLGPGGEPPVELDPPAVKHIHHRGGTVLGSSRGAVTPSEMLSGLRQQAVNVLFCIGGDGTLRGAHALAEEATRQGHELALIGVPKTIDNDIPFIERTFGFETAVAIAKSAIDAAHVEAQGAPRGIGLVKLMGRHSGYIAASAALASRDANLVLVPELPFDIEGESGVLAYLKRRLAKRDHAVIVVAEGAGQDLMQATGKTDASGNQRLADVGQYLRQEITAGLNGMGVTLKYIDPSYMIRAAPANPGDAIFCGQLAEDAVHAAMAGKTGIAVGLWLGQRTHVPLSAVTQGRNVISLDSPLWRNVVESTGQPARLR